MAEVYQEDLFQRIVNVGWPRDLWGVLWFTSDWDGGNDNTNGLPCIANTLTFPLPAVPPQIDDPITHKRLVDASPPYSNSSTLHHGGTVTSIEDFTCDVEVHSGLDTSFLFGFQATHTTGTGIDWWTNPFTVGTYDTLAALVAAAVAPGTPIISNVNSVGSHSGLIGGWDEWQAQKAVLVFFDLTNWKSLFGLSLLVAFQTGGNPTDPRETGSTFYKWQATFRTFRNLSRSKLTASGTNTPDSSWWDHPVASLQKTSPGGGTASQTGNTVVGFAVDLTSLAVTG